MAKSIDEIVCGALQPAVLERVYADVAPPNTPRPYATYQAVGGEDAGTFDGPATTANSRVQVNVWSNTRNEATALIQRVISVLCAPSIAAVPIGAPVSIYEDDTKLRGSRLDFSIWFAL
jgi:Protein of unknown function (DUF3168)